MASKRKSTTPCMVLSSETLGHVAEMEVTDGDGKGEGSAAPAEGAVVSHESEPEHSSCHEPMEESFSEPMSNRRVQTGVEQLVRDLAFDRSLTTLHENDEVGDLVATGISFSKTPIMKMRSKAEAKRILVSHPPVDEGDVGVESEGELSEAIPVDLLGTVGVGAALPAEQVKHCIIISSQSQVWTDPKKIVMNSATILPAGLAQVLSALQVQQNAQSQLLIPLSSIPTYSMAMDNSALLVSAYSKFPYPSMSEIMSLAVQTKFSEEQIKIWFSAQRLKHGVSWTPEEVEEARKKHFNGTVHTVPPSVTIIPAHLSAAANGLHSVLQTCQIVGQPGLLLTQVSGANPLPVTTPITLTVTGLPGQVQPPKPTNIQASAAAVEVKRAATVQPPAVTPPESSALSADHLGLRAKKSKEQLGALKASYLKNRFASDAEISRLMKVTGLTKGEIKKWFSDTRYNQRNSKTGHGPGFGDSSTLDGDSNASYGTAFVIDSSDETTESPASCPVRETRSKVLRNPFPDFTLQKFKEKTPEQLLLLEGSYQNSSTPTDEELNRLRAETKLTRREVDTWFTERRKGLTSLKDMEMLKPTSSVNSRRQDREKVGKRAPEQLHILKAAFVRTQWPSAEEYDKLAEESGLPRSYIVNWFGDTRYAWKNGNLKWYYFYQSGDVSAVSGTGYWKRGRGRTRHRGRGWSRRNRRSSRPAIKFKTGKDILKEYYLQHKFLNEQDLDELVAKSNMSYEQVRDWFSDIIKMEDTDPSENSVVEQQQHTEDTSKVEEEEEKSKAAVNEEEEGDENDKGDAREPPQSVRKHVSGSEG